MIDKVELKAALVRLFYSNHEDDEDYDMLMDYIENSIYCNNKDNLDLNCSIEFRNDDMVIHTNCPHCNSKINMRIDKNAVDDFCNTFEVMKCEDTKAQTKT